ncbi:TPA: helix-turn-helix transcriptional regulator, partial [Klebsiella michiganensis]|nr:helix-turn-helix transcriptional regulator [Klebsiella michiganensis]
VRELRSARGMQQEKLALIAGIDRGHMGKIERGETRVTLEKVYLIAKALGVSPASLLP